MCIAMKDCSLYFFLLLLSLGSLRPSLTKRKERREGERERGLLATFLISMFGCHGVDMLVSCASSIRVRREVVRGGGVG